MKCANFYWISITGYIPVTLWKGQPDQNSMSRLSDLCNVHGWHRGTEKRPLLACIGNAGGQFKPLWIIENLSSRTSRFICDPRGCAQSKEAIQDHWLIDYSIFSVFMALAWQKCKRYKSELWSSLSSTRRSVSVDAFVQPPSQNKSYRTNQG